MPSPAHATFGQPTQLRPSCFALSMLFSDWSRSGRMDLRISNDKQYYLPTDGEEQLWRISPGAPPSLYTADDGWENLQVNGMGIASYDINGDGYPETDLTNQADNRPQTLASHPPRPQNRNIE